MNTPSVVILFLTISTSHTREVFYDFTISRYVGDPDGVTKEVIGINGQSPGPVIRVVLGDIITVRVHNRLGNGKGTSIHWHGLLQTWNNIHDGVSWITQYPIPAGGSYTYKFRAEEAGIFWYHSHHRQQWTDGLYGLLIIEDPPHVPQPYDAELFLILDEHSHFPSPAIYTWYSAQTEFRRLPVMDTVLINGRGIYPCEYAHRLDLPCQPLDQVEYSQIRVRPGLTYRIRILSACINNAYTLQIDNHSFRIIEGDGVPSIGDKVFERVYIDTAQRVSLLVHMNQTTHDQFWIRIENRDLSHVDFGPKQANSNPFPAVANVLLDFPKIVLKYDPHADISNKDDNALEIAHPPYPTTTYKKIKFIADERVIFPSESQPLSPSHVNESHTFFKTDILGRKDTGTGFNYMKLDLRHVTEPALYVVARGEKLPLQFNPIYISGFGPDYVVELILNNAAATGHPLHLHGHNIWIVGNSLSAGPFDEERLQSKIINGGVAPFRDTQGITVDGHIVVRFIANNPSVWLFHCHAEVHLGTGMGFVIVVNEEKIQRQFNNGNLQLK